MEVRELRIGNWVKWVGNSCKVDLPLLSTEFSDRDESIDIEPIPITEDILLRCGFIKEYKDLRSSYTPYAYVGDVYYYGEFSYYQGTGEWGYRCSKIEAPKDLHQLQNIYYALTSQEMIINLKIEE